MRRKIDLSNFVKGQQQVINCSRCRVLWSCQSHQTSLAILRLEQMESSTDGFGQINVFELHEIPRLLGRGRSKLVGHLLPPYSSDYLRRFPIILVISSCGFQSETPVIEL